MKYCHKTMYDLLRKENDLSREIDTIDDQIVENLYVTEENKNEKVRKEAEDTVISLRERKAMLQTELKNTRDEFKRAILRLFE